MHQNLLKCMQIYVLKILKYAKLCIKHLKYSKLCHNNFSSTSHFYRKSRISTRNKCTNKEKKKEKRRNTN